MGEAISGLRSKCRFIDGSGGNPWSLPSTRKTSVTRLYMLTITARPALTTAWIAATLELW